MAEILLILRFFLALLLYAFLGVILYTLWKELQKGILTTDLQFSAATLHVEAGIDTGQLLQLHPVTAVGRAEGNDLILHDPFASAHHTLLLWREGQWWLEDLESHNGTYLNEERLHRPRALASGDRIRIGESILRFQLNQESAPETPDLTA